MNMQVKDVSGLAGVSIRTLHHYDEIGLLVPSAVTSSGYRLYNAADLEKLQQILFFKEIGFSLQEIKEILVSPGFDRRKALAAHKEMLLEKRARMDRMLETVERTIRSIDEGEQMADHALLFEGFDMEKIKAHQAKYAEEARRLYGKNIVDETDRRTSGYSNDKWKEIHAGIGRMYTRLAERMPFGPSDPEAQETVASWRQFITDHFYDCTPEIFRGLGDLYVEDERFKANFEKTAPGLAAFAREAMHLYCDRLEGKNQT